MSSLTMGSKKILVATSQNLLAEGICLLIKHSDTRHSIGYAKTMQSLKAILQHNSCDAVVLAEPTFGFPISFVAREIKNTNPYCSIIALQTGRSIFSASCMLKNGIKAWFPPDCDLTEVLDALGKVERGAMYMSEYMAERIAYEVSGRDAPHMMLSDRETEVLFFLIKGYSLTKTAKLLLISLEAVYRYFNNIKRVLRINNKSELIHYSLEHNILP
jgi:DNA-binding NarL/FixJ family response regulator